MLINSDEQLRQYIPNAFATAIGEPTLFEKLSTYLEDSELWFTKFFAPVTMLDAISKYAAPVIVANAYLRALPVLNIVLTPNGFATVGTQDVVAASARRTETLAEGLTAHRDSCIGALLRELPKYEEWLSSPQADFFGGTLFPETDVVKSIGIFTDIWEEYLGHLELIRNIEFSLAQSFISPELMSALRKENLRHTLTHDRAFAVMVLKNQIVSSLRSDIPCNEQCLRDLVQFIRTRPESFPEWHSSTTAMLFSPPKFENKKQSTGYFF